MALGLALSTAPLAFVAIATANRQGMSEGYGRLLERPFFVALLAGALLGYLVLQHQPLEAPMMLAVLASGFRIPTVDRESFRRRIGKTSRASPAYCTSEGCHLMP